LLNSDEQLARTRVAAQDIRLIFQCGDRAQAQEALYRWLAYCAEADIPELTRLARTIDSWHTELLAYFDTSGMSNGDRSDQLADQKGSSGYRTRTPQLRQLPAPPPTALRRRLGHYPRHPDQRPVTTLSGVEPDIRTLGYSGHHPSQRIAQAVEGVVGSPTHRSEGRRDAARAVRPGQPVSGPTVAAPTAKHHSSGTSSAQQRRAVDNAGRTPAV
jgi:hypothetical protein